MPQPGPDGSVAPTSWESIAIAAVVGAGLGWVSFAALDRFTGNVPDFPVLVAGVIALFAAAVGVQAWQAHRTIQVRRRPIAPSRAVALLALGKSCLLAGAALAGAYAAITVFLVLRLVLNMPAERLVGPAAALVASAGLAVAGALLERACRVPAPPSDDATPEGLPGTQDPAD